LVVGILFRGAVEDFLSGCKSILRADFSASRVGIIVLDKVSGVVNVDRLPIEELLCGWGYSNGRLVLLIWHVDVVGILLLLLLLVVAIVVVVIVVILIVLVNVTLGDLLLDVHVGTAGVFDFNGRGISALIFYVILVVLLLLEELLVVVTVIIVLVLLLILLVIEVLLLHLRV